MRVLVGFLGMLTALSVHGCGHSCTEMGCVQGVTINLTSPLEKSGEYRFEVNADGQILTCTAFIPMKRDGTDPSCPIGLTVERQVITTSTGDAVTGTSGDPIVALGVSGNFTRVSVTATLDGGEVLSATVTPRYEGVEINGEGCGKCPMATHTIGG